MSFQNVSPVDATNILGRAIGSAASRARQLQRADGVRYWAYRNLRDFVVYTTEDSARTRCAASTRFATTTRRTRAGTTSRLADMLRLSVPSTRLLPCPRTDPDPAHDA